MKLYKNTLIISIIVFLVCIALSVAFEFTCISKFQPVSFLSDYMIGIVCSIIVVIITTFIQFKYEQKKLLNSVLSDVQFFFFHYLLIVMSLYPNEETSDKLWEYYYDETYGEIRKISSQLLNIEWFSKKKTKIAGNLQKAALHIMMEIAKCSGKTKKDSLLCVLDTSWLNEIKDNALLLAESNEHLVNEITNNYERVQLELKNLKYSKCEEV